MIEYRIKIEFIGSLNNMWYYAENTKKETTQLFKSKKALIRAIKNNQVDWEE